MRTDRRLTIYWRIRGGGGGGVSGQGGCVVCRAGGGGVSDQPPPRRQTPSPESGQGADPLDRMTHACENITFAALVRNARSVNIDI